MQNKGLNFATIIKWISYLDTIAPWRKPWKSPRHKPRSWIEKWRRYLETVKPPKDHNRRINGYQYPAEWYGCYHTASKSNLIGVMNQAEKLASLDGNSNYCKITKDLTLICDILKAWITEWEQSTPVILYKIPKRLLTITEGQRKQQL